LECCSQALGSGGLGSADFASVARSCKRLKDVAEEALYAHNRDREGSSAVDWAAKHGSIGTLQKALSHRLSIEPTREEYPKSEDSPGLLPGPEINPLLTAVKHGQDEAVAWFLDHGVDVTRRVHPRCRCRIDETCILHSALCSRHASTALLLISRGAPSHYLIRCPQNPESVRHTHVNALLEASVFGLDELVEALVKHHGMKLQMGHQNALTWATMHNGNVSTIRTLVRLGADVNSSLTDCERSPLRCAILDRNYAIANTLLDLGAKIRLDDYDPFEYDHEGGEPPFSVSPLHDTIASCTWMASTALSHVYLWPRPDEDVGNEKILLMKRLIELGVDVNMKAWGIWQYDEMRLCSPLELAIDLGDMEYLSILLAAGAQVDCEILSDAWQEYDDKKTGNCEKMIRLFLRYGGRLDEPSTITGQSVLQMVVLDAMSDLAESGLHDLLLLSSTKSLSREHLGQVLEECLMQRNWYAAAVLIRHGARVSGENRLFSIAKKMIDELESDTPELVPGTQELGSDTEEDDIQAPFYVLGEVPGPYTWIGYLIDMGLSSEDQCLLFYDILRKKKILMADLLLGRGLMSRPEATQYLPAFLMLAASWGDVSVISRLWQHAYEALDPTMRLLMVYNSIIQGNAQATSFFVDHGVSPVDILSPAQVSELFKAMRGTIPAQVATLKALGGPSADLLVSREYRRMQLLSLRYGGLREDTSACFLLCVSPLQLAVRYGHVEIISRLLQHVTQNVDAAMMCRNVHIPCVLAKANEIREMMEKAVDLACWSNQLRNM
jgi:hypothetical protein